MRPACADTWGFAVKIGNVGCVEFMKKGRKETEPRATNF